MVVLVAEDSEVAEVVGVQHIDPIIEVE